MLLTFVVVYNMICCYFCVSCHGISTHLMQQNDDVAVISSTDRCLVVSYSCLSDVVCKVLDVVAATTKLTTVKKDSKEIWTEDEVTAGAEFDDLDDPRQQPQSVITLCSRRHFTPSVSIEMLSYEQHCSVHILYTYCTHCVPWHGGGIAITRALPYSRLILRQLQKYAG